mgnify:CR=1 FL=1
MDLPLFSIMLFCFVLVALLAVYLYRKQKFYYLPSTAMLGLTFLLLAYTQVSINPGSWDDLGYVILAITIFFLSIITTLIVFIYRFIKYNKNKSKVS